MKSPVEGAVMRRAYPSDLTEARWRVIAALIDPPAVRGRKRKVDLREVVNAINYRWTTGCPWRMLPHDFPAWETVYAYFGRWQKQGLLRQIREVLLRRSVYVPLETWPATTPEPPQPALRSGQPQPSERSSEDRQRLHPQRPPQSRRESYRPSGVAVRGTSDLFRVKRPRD